MTSGLRAERVTLAYQAGQPVVCDLSLTVPDGRITCIVGPNACGKSTLLRALARLLKPRGGSVLLDGQAIFAQPTKAVARRLGLLPQAPTAPEGLTVADLVGRGRFPHQRLFQQWSAADECAVEEALTLTRTDALRDRPVDELSGGQRQRVWIAMALAQDTPTMLLDEPTTFLDIAHQIEVLDLLAELNETHGRTIVLVLHDLNHGCRYAHHLVAMRDGRIVAEGDPARRRHRRSRRTCLRHRRPRHRRSRHRDTAGGARTNPPPPRRTTRSAAQRPGPRPQRRGRHGG